MARPLLQKPWSLLWTKFRYLSQLEGGIIEGPYTTRDTTSGSKDGGGGFKIGVVEASAKGASSSSSEVEQIVRETPVAKFTRLYKLLEGDIQPLNGSGRLTTFCQEHLEPIVGETKPHAIDRSLNALREMTSASSHANPFIADRPIAAYIIETLALNLRYISSVVPM